MKPAPLYFINAIVIPAAITFSKVLLTRNPPIREIVLIAAAWLIINVIIVAANYKTNAKSLALAAFSGIMMGVVILAIVQQVMPIKMRY